MAKIELPEVRYICQDSDGTVHLGFGCDGNVPRLVEVDQGYPAEWLIHKCIYDYIKGEPNPNWKNTLIDLETDDYDYTDGILTRIEKK